MVLLSLKNIDALKSVTILYTIYLTIATSFLILIPLKKYNFKIYLIIM